MGRRRDSPVIRACHQVWRWHAPSAGAGRHRPPLLPPPARSTFGGLQEAGRRIMSAGAGPPADSTQHVVQFYGSDDDMADRASRYLAAGLRRGETAVVVATAANLRAVEARMAAACEVAALRSRGRFITLDAVEALDRIVIRSRFCSRAAERMVGDLVKEALTASPGICFYGEMGALAWNAGRPDTTIQLEALWSDLSQRLPLRSLCGYPAPLACQSGILLRDICDLHTAVAGIPPLI
jgi:MEDS: MEthanogen/methylotroph, DcmR Sensory domain